MKKMMIVICAVILAQGLQGQNATWAQSATGPGPWELNADDNWDGNAKPGETGTATFNKTMTNTLFATEDFTVANATFSTAPQQVTLDMGGYGFYVTSLLKFDDPLGATLRLTDGTLGVNKIDFVGNASGDNATCLTVSGALASLKASGDIRIGASTGIGNTLRIESGATFTATNVAIAWGGNGNVLTNNAFIVDGATATLSGTLNLGQNAASDYNIFSYNTIRVANGGTLSVAGATTLSYNGVTATNNLFIVESSGTFTTKDLTLRARDNRFIVTNATVWVTGALGSSGDAGKEPHAGGIFVRKGGTLNVQGGTSWSGTGNVLAVSGTGAVFKAMGDLRIGASISSNNVFRVENGGSFTGTKLVVAYGGNGNINTDNSFIVDGDGSSVSLSGDVYMGSIVTGTGDSYQFNTLRVANGGTLKADGATVFNDMGNTGAGFPGSTHVFGASNNLIVVESGGEFSTAQLHLRSQGNRFIVSNGTVKVAGNVVFTSIVGEAPQNNSLTVSGEAALLEVLGDVRVGSSPSRANSFRVENGATFNGTNLWVAQGGNGNIITENEFVVDGATATLSGELRLVSSVGVGSVFTSNTIRVSNGGTLSVNGTTTLSYGPPDASNNFFIMESGSDVTFGNRFIVAGTDNRIVVSNGTVRFSADFSLGSTSSCSNNFLVICGTNSLVVKAAFETLRLWHNGGLEFIVGRHGYARTPMVVEGGYWNLETDGKIIVRATEWAARTGGRATLMTVPDTLSRTTVEYYVEHAELDDNAAYWLDIDDTIPGVRSIVCCAPSKATTQILVR